MDELFEGLNAQQLSAMIATEGNVRIVAGAGSGKTKTLTHRFGYLVIAAGIQPGNILCVTFTNKAAREMKKRVRKLIGDGCDSSLITTYHGFCVRVLRDDIYRVMYPKTFSILNEIEQRRILAEIYGEMDLKMDKATFENVMQAIHRLKSNEAYVDLMINNQVDHIVVPPADSNTPVNPFEVSVIKKYLLKQKKLFALDFDDLIAFTFTIFARFPEVREKWAEQLYYIQVDEFQDSSQRELRLIKALCANHQNLFVVGDPDQNIYEWRGADMAILVDFDKIFPDTQTILLNQNYRSTGNILKVANTLIAHNKNRIPKDLYTVGESGPNVIHLHSKSEYDEGRWISREIKRLVKDEGLEYRDIAILYRASFLSRFIEQALMAANIPYEIYGSVRFYDRMEIRDVLSYLKLLLSDDDAAFERIINTPRRNFGKARLNALKNIAENENASLYSTLKLHQNEAKFTNPDIEQFILLIENLRQQIDEMPVSELLQKVITESGYEKYIRELGSTERLDNLTECKRAIWEREQGYGEYYSLNIYLQEVALESNYDLEENLDRVKLMTIHASKGLEFPACFVCGMTEGIFPSGRTIEERAEAGLEEERRLCFVAVTRAMKYLYLTESEGDSENNSHKRPSRFLFDMGENNYRRIGIIPKDLMDFSIKSNTRAKLPVRSIGDWVQHPIFGRGRIAKIDMVRRVYDIEFKMGHRPVSMDYDFDAWQNLAKRQALARENIANHAQGVTQVRIEHPALPAMDEKQADSHRVTDILSSFQEHKNDDKRNDVAPHTQVTLFPKILSEPQIRLSQDNRLEQMLALLNDNPTGSDNAHDNEDVDANEAIEDVENKDVIDAVDLDAAADAFIVDDDDAVDDDADVVAVDDIDDAVWEFYTNSFEQCRDMEAAVNTVEKVLDELEVSEGRCSNNPSNASAGRISTVGIPKSRQRSFEHEDWAQPFAGNENLWLRRDVPHHGWECVSVIDLGKPLGICRMCGKQIIRYVHVMKHPNYYRTIGAGCVCAGKMQQNIARARERERLFKLRQTRKANFVNRYKKRYLERPCRFMVLDERPDLNISIRMNPQGLFCYTFRRNGISESKLYPSLDEVLMAIYDNIIEPWRVMG